jgi:hypothetical protein
MEKKMSKLGDALPYIALAAVGGAGLGLAGAGAGTTAGATIAPAASGSAATGLMGTYGTGTATNALLASKAGSALAPEAAFLAGLSGTSPSVAPLATDVTMSSIFNPSTINPYESMEGVSFIGDAPVKSVGGWEQPFLGQTEFAPVTESALGDYAFMGGHESLPQWKQLGGMANVTNYAVEEGTKTLMDQLGLGYGDALSLASQFYSSSMQQPNYQTGMPTPTLRQYQYRPSTMAQIAGRNRINTNMPTRRSYV